MNKLTHEEDNTYRCPDITIMGMCPFTGYECPMHLEKCPDRITEVKNK